MRLPNFVVRAGLVVAAIALLPTTILGQGVDTREYQLRQLAGSGLHARGFTAESFYILETLGDDALLAGDTTAAIESYRHAAWIAADAARGANIAFDPRIPGWRDDRASVQTAAAEAERVLNKAVSLGGEGSAAVAPRRIDADPGDWEVGIEVGRVLSALGEIQMAVMVYEIVGDEAIAAGDTDMAEQAFSEGSLLAYQEYLRLSLNWTPRIQGARTDFIPMRDTAERLADKAERAGR